MLGSFFFGIAIIFVIFLIALQFLFFCPEFEAEQGQF